MIPNLKYTMIFIKRDHSLLLLNRNKPPLMGLWTGVGGKIEANETPLDGAKREVREETGLCVEELCFRGVATWTTETDQSGMYLYMCDLPKTIDYDTPRVADEGILDWKDVKWILASKNAGIPPHVHQFIPSVLDGQVRLHRFVLNNLRVVEYRNEPMTGVL